MAKVARLLLGPDKNGKQVFNLSLPGYDAYNEDPLLNPQKFAFSSEWDSVDRILEVGRISNNFTSNPTQFDVFIPRPGFDPMFKVFGESSAGDAYEDMWTSLAVAGSTRDRVNSFVAHLQKGANAFTTKLRIENTTGRVRALAGVQQFRYIVFDLPANNYIYEIPDEPPEEVAYLFATASAPSTNGTPALYFPPLQKGDLLVCTSRTSFNNDDRWAQVPPGFTPIVGNKVDSSSGKGSVYISYKIATGLETGHVGLSDVGGDSATRHRGDISVVRLPFEPSAISVADVAISGMGAFTHSHVWAARTAPIVVQFLHCPGNHVFDSSGNYVSTNNMTNIPGPFEAVSTTGTEQFDFHNDASFARTAHLSYAHIFSAACSFLIYP